MGCLAEDLAKAAVPKSQGGGIVPAKISHLAQQDAVVTGFNQLMQLAVKPGRAAVQAQAAAGLAQDRRTGKALCHAAGGELLGQGLLRLGQHADREVPGLGKRLEAV
jgi:hypothetical protein